MHLRRGLESTPFVLGTNFSGELGAITDQSGSSDNSSGVQGDRPRVYSKKLGELAESLFLSKAVGLGFAVAKPWGDSEPYDFILDSGRRLWRVQVKARFSALTDRGRYVIHAHGGSYRCYTADEVDVLVAYVVPVNAWYVFPIAALRGIVQIHLSSHAGSRSKYETYREAWCWMACKKQPTSDDHREHRSTGEHVWDSLKVIPRCLDGSCPLRDEICRCKEKPTKSLLSNNADGEP